MKINDAKATLRGVLDSGDWSEAQKEAMQIALMAMERQAHQESLKDAEPYPIEEYLYDFSLNENGRIPCTTTINGVKYEFEITKRTAKDFVFIFEKIGA